MAKWIIGIIVLVLIAVGLWWSGWLPTMPSQTATSTPQTQTQTQTQAPTNGMSANDDTSDAALVQDSTAVDAQMQGLTSDSSSIDSSLNDKPVQQSY